MSVKATADGGGWTRAHFTPINSVDGMTLVGNTKLNTANPGKKPVVAIHNGATSIIGGCYTDASNPAKLTAAIGLGGAGTDSSGPAAANTSTFTPWAITFEDAGGGNTAMTIYVGDTSHSAVGSIPNFSPEWIMIGQDFGGHCDCSTDDVILFKQKLTTAQITAQFASAAPILSDASIAVRGSFRGGSDDQVFATWIPAGSGGGDAATADYDASDRTYGPTLSGSVTQPIA